MFARRRKADFMRSSPRRNQPHTASLGGLQWQNGGSEVKNGRSVVVGQRVLKLVIQCTGSPDNNFDCSFFCL